MLVPKKPLAPGGGEGASGVNSHWLQLSRNNPSPSLLYTLSPLHQTRQSPPVASSAACGANNNGDPVGSPLPLEEARR